VTRFRERAKPANRRGFTIFEVAVSAVVLGAVITTAAQLVQWSVSLHQLALKKRCALEAATTVLDRMSAREWSSITAQAANEMSLPPETKAFLGDPRLAVAVTNEGEEPRGKKVSVEISWAERAGKPTQQVHLATWVFAPGAEK
jgi:Tfp pilus assembly protein PilV